MERAAQTNHPSLRQEALRLAFAFVALLIVGLMTNVGGSRESIEPVQLVVSEKTRTPAQNKEKTQIDPIASIGLRGNR